MKDLIYNQRAIPRSQWRYGFRSSADTGCGWIAVYNALRLMGYRTDIEALIRYCEWQLPLIHGNAGTSFWGPALCFRKWGFPVEVCFSSRRFDAVLEEHDVGILFYHWRKKHRLGAHFVALHRQNGHILGYNTFRNSTGPDRLGDSLEAFLKKQGYWGCVLIGIRRKQ